MDNITWSDPYIPSWTGKFDTEEDYLRSLKKEDRYHFTVPFEYIVKRLGNDEYEVAMTNMEVDVFWNEEDIGYDVSYWLPEADKIDPNEGNGDADEIYENIVSPIIRDTLTDMGFVPEALCAEV